MDRSSLHLLVRQHFEKSPTSLHFLRKTGVRGVKFNLLESLQALFFLQVWKLEGSLREDQGKNFSSQVPDSEASLRVQAVPSNKVRLNPSLQEPLTHTPQRCLGSAGTAQAGPGHPGLVPEALPGSQASGPAAPQSRSGGSTGVLPQRTSS